MSVTTGNIESMDLQAESQDAVFAWMVIEHVHDPQSTFNKIANSSQAGRRLSLQRTEFRLLGTKTFGAILVRFSVGSYYFTSPSMNWIVCFKKPDWKSNVFIISRAFVTSWEVSD